MKLSKLESNECFFNNKSIIQARIEIWLTKTTINIIQYIYKQTPHVHGFLTSQIGRPKHRAKRRCCELRLRPKNVINWTPIKIIEQQRRSARLAIYYFDYSSYYCWADIFSNYPTRTPLLDSTQIYECRLPFPFQVPRCFGTERISECISCLSSRGTLLVQGFLCRALIILPVSAQSGAAVLRFEGKASAITDTWLYHEDHHQSSDACARVPPTLHKQ